MIKILVLEDEKSQQERLSQFLARYAQANPDFQYIMTLYDRGIQFLTDYRRDADLIFLDIRVPDMLGFDVAKKLRKTDENVMIVFITSLTQYAIEGYSVGAFDYILKPLRYASFAAKMDRIRRSLSHRENRVMLDLRTKEGGQRVSADSITYIESEAHDISVHTDGQVIRVWGTLSKFEEELKTADFVRCNTSYLVNLKYVQTVRKDEVVVGGAALPISRSRRKAFLEALARYKGGSL